MKRLLIAVALVVCLQGCAQTMQQKAAVACTARASAIEVLTVANDKGKINKIDQAKISEAIGITHTVCTDPNSPTITQAQIDILTSYLAVLNSTATTVK